MKYDPETDTYIDKRGRIHSWESDDAFEYRLRQNYKQEKRKQAEQCINRTIAIFRKILR